VVESSAGLSESYSITIVTSVVGNPIYVSTPRSSSNAAEDFLVFVAGLLRNEVLVNGDVLIVDNASVHYADSIASMLDEILAVRGVRMFFLPSYSPELNPCELVFAQVKHYLRRHRGNLPFLFEIALAFAHVSAENVRHYYEECLTLNIA